MILDNELGDPIHSPPALQPYEPSSKNEKQKKKRGGKTSIFTGKKSSEKKERDRETRTRRNRVSTGEKKKITSYPGRVGLSPW